MKNLSIILCAAAALAVSGTASAGGAIDASAKALEHSLQAVGYTLIGGVKLASGAVALPLVLVGEIGAVTGQAGDEMWEFADAPVDEAFPVSDEVVTAGPQPDAALDRRLQVQPAPQVTP